MMRISEKKTIIAVLAPVLAVVMLIAGCGSDKSECGAPAGSSVAVSGPQTGASYAFDTPVNYVVVVKYPDGKPMPQACLTISGAFAFPRNSAATGWHYRFYRYPNGTQDSSNVAVNNGFSAETDDFGQYTFSAEISVATGTFTDTIMVQSGSIFGTAGIDSN